MHSLTVIIITHGKIFVNSFIEILQMMQFLIISFCFTSMTETKCKKIWKNSLTNSEKYAILKTDFFENIF